MRSQIRRWVVASAGLVLMFGPAGRATASIILTMTEVGGDVVVSGGGTVNLASLVFIGVAARSSDIEPLTATIQEGIVPIAGSDVYEGVITGPAQFGTGTLQFPTIGGGDAFGIFGSVPRLEVPQFYISGSTLHATDTYTNQTFSTLGVNPGTYVWTWGSSDTADSFTLQIGPSAVPEPSTVIVAVFGAVAFTAYGWSRHRRAQGRQAAA